MKKIIFLVFLLTINLSCFSQGGLWTWMGGDSTYSQSCISGCAVHGTKGIPDPANTPEKLYSPLCWKDLHGKFWLYGGTPYNTEMINDMWSYDPSISMWTWIAGDSGALSSPSNHGIRGIASPTNNPGARTFGSATWVDTSGNLWLFGGGSFDDNGQSGFMNDLWKYDVDSGMWTWMKGSKYRNDVGNIGIMGVADTANNPHYDGEIGACWVDNGNNLWFYGGRENQSHLLWKYEITSNTWTWMKGSLISTVAIRGIKGVEDSLNNPGNRIVHAHWKDNEGNFWIWGGAEDLAYERTYNDLWKYNLATNNWTWMNGTSNLNPGVVHGNYCEADTSYEISGEYESRACWTDSQGNFWIYSGLNFYTGVDYHNEDHVWCYYPVTNQWAYLKGTAPFYYGNIKPRYRTKGVADTLNSPGGRCGSAIWKASNDDIWIYGGKSYVFNGSFLENFNMKDLWKYVPDQCAAIVYVDSYGETSQAIEISQMTGTGNFEIRNNNNSEAIRNICIYNLESKLLIKRNGNNEISFSMDGNSKGIYICKIQFDSGKQVVKKFSFN